jgi:hypothetical protein
MDSPQYRCFGRKQIIPLVFNISQGIVKTTVIELKAPSWRAQAKPPFYLNTGFSSYAPNH